MDTVKLTLLRAEIERQMARITQAYQTLEARVDEIASGVRPLVESAAYQTHNYYSAVEMRPKFSKIGKLRSKYDRC